MTVSPKTNVVRKWYAESVKAARDLYRSGAGYAESGLKWLLEHVPPALIHAVAVAAFATKKGYHTLVDSSFALLRLLGKAVKFAARGVHYGLTWIGYRAADLVKPVHLATAEKIADANYAFTAWRWNTGRIVAAGTNLVLDEINQSAKAPAVTGLINTVSSIVLVGLGLTALSALTGPLAGVASATGAILGFAAAIPVVGPVLGVGSGLVHVATLSSVTGVVMWMLKITLIATTIEMVFRGGKVVSAFKDSTSKATVGATAEEPTIPTVVVEGHVVDGEQLADSIIAAGEATPKPRPNKKHRAHK
jgi:hypothetical protein